MTTGPKNHSTAVTSLRFWLWLGFLLAFAAFLFGECNWLILFFLVFLLLVPTLLVALAVVIHRRMYRNMQREVDRTGRPDVKLFEEGLLRFEKYRSEFMQLAISAPLVTVASLQMFPLLQIEIAEIPLILNLSSTTLPFMIVSITVGTSVYMMIALVLFLMLSKRWVVLRSMISSLGLAFALTLVMILLVQIGLVTHFFWSAVPLKVT